VNKHDPSVANLNSPLLCTDRRIRAMDVQKI